MPIKGTRPLGEHVEGAKDEAEHVMIVDLERNDLSRVCEPGSVRWPELMAERELAGVTHLVSRVEGTLREDVSLAELLAATFPGGSVTGAPKLAALDEIARLEPVGRGASMGALGTVRGNGDLELALTIRTFAIADGRIHLWVGGGIVWDSDPQEEIEESWTKARPLLSAIGAPLEVQRMTLLAVAVGGRGLVDPDEPVLRADDEALLRGRAAFETVRVYGGSPIGSPSISSGWRSRRSGSACRRQTCSSSPSSRPRRSRLPTPATQSFASSGRPGTARARRPRSRSSSSLPTHYDALRERGQRLISLRGVRAEEPWLLPGVKSTSYAVNMAAEAEARRQGSDDAVFVDGDGVVLEGPTTNIWWRRERTLFTPALELGILAGVTRAAVLELAGGLDYEVVEGTFPLADLAGSRRGVHLVVRARGDARHRARRRAARPRPGGGRAPGGAAC